MTRYSRQELILGKEGQRKLAETSVMIVGMGALGTVSAELLTRAGVGKLALLDRDLVEETNLQRQTLYAEDDIGKPKAEQAAERLRKINSSMSITAVITDLNHRNIHELSEGHDLILDCTDNLYTRFLINEFSRKTGIPWIHAAAIRQQGNVMTITKDTPCFRCIFEEASGLETCDTAGVLNTITTAISALQVREAIRVIAGKFEGQELLSLDLEAMQLARLKTKSNKDCPACKGDHPYLDGKRELRSIEHQCSDLYQFYAERIDLQRLRGQWERLGEVRASEHALFFAGISAFDNGRILIKAKNKDHAKAELSKYFGL